MQGSDFTIVQGVQQELVEEDPQRLHAILWYCTGRPCLSHVPGTDCLVGCRDVLYLDLALDGAVRSAVESSLTFVKTDTSQEEEEELTSLLIDLVTVCTENVCFSAGSNLELSMVHKDYQVTCITLHDFPVQACPL